MGEIDKPDTYNKMNIVILAKFLRCAMKVGQCLTLPPSNYAHDCILLHDKSYKCMYMFVVNICKKERRKTENSISFFRTFNYIDVRVCLFLLSLFPFIDFKLLRG